MERQSNSANVELDVIDSVSSAPPDGNTVVPAGVVAIGAAKRTHYVPSNETEKVLDNSINLKYDVFVLLVLALDMFLQRVDATNIGFIPTGSDFLRQTQIKSDEIGDAEQIFLAAFITTAPFSTILGRKLGLRNYLVGLMACSGALTVAHASIHGTTTLFVLRVLLGIAQSGFLPTAWCYIAGIYPKQYLGFRMCLFVAIYSLFESFSGILAYGILKINAAAPMRNWQVLFALEGLITIFFAFFSLVMLPPSAEQARFLSPMEQRHAIRRMDADTIAAYDALGSTELRVQDVMEVMKDWRKMGIVIFNCLAAVPDAAFATFLPVVLHAMGYDGIDEHLMHVVPFVTALISLLVIAKLSDRWFERSPWITAGGCITIIGLVAFVASGKPVIRYVFIHLCLGGSLVIEPLVAAWLVGNTPIGAQRSVLMGVNGWSEVATVIANQMFKDQHAPTYRTPLGFSLLLLGISLIGFQLVRWTYSRLNRSRVEETKSWTREQLGQEMAKDKSRGDHLKTYLYGY